MDYFVTMPKKLLLLSYVMSWPVVLAYPELHSRPFPIIKAMLFRFSGKPVNEAELRD